MQIWIYDIEVYKNLFMFTAVHKDQPDLKRKFLIYASSAKAIGDYRKRHPHADIEFLTKDGCRNDYLELVRFCNQPKTLWLVGYNNYNYDNQIVNFLILSYWMLKNKTPKEICMEAYKLSVEIISNQDKGGYSKFKFGDYFRSIDLMRVGNIKKGLKQVAVNLKWHRIQDLPIPFDKPVDVDKIIPMFDYNLNDCGITRALYVGNERPLRVNKYIPARKGGKGLAEKIRLRDGISNQYGVDVMNEADSGIANKLFEKLYSEKTGLHPAQFRELRTERFMVLFKDAVFPNIKFQTPELQKFLANLLEEGVVCNGDKITIDLPSLWYGGVEYQFGAGGLHSVDKGAVFEACAKYEYRDADVGSFYPRIMINFRVAPAHLNKEAFLAILEEQTDGRLEDKALAKKYKKEGNDVLEIKFQIAADGKKIVVNATFGKLGFKHGFLYDPLAMIQVTINGQLFLMMLIERLTLAGFQIISANTDGIVTKVDRARRAEYDAICDAWQAETGFELEYASYKKYIRRDVNNYLVLKELEEGEEFSYDNHIKTKGDLDPFLYEDFTKGFDKPVVSLAVYNHFINGIPIQETIRNHDDIYDFCMSKKNDSSYDNEFYAVIDGEVVKETLQKSNRFYISTNGNGGKLIKAKDSDKGRKRAQQVAGEYVTIFNDHEERPMSSYNIKYMYYIIEAQKIIDAIVPRQQSLF